MKTVCPLDCFDTCGLVVTVSDGRVVRVEGDPDHPITRGFICSKGRSFVERSYSPERVVHPLIRGTDGRWEQASWDRALDIVGSVLETARSERGSEAVFYNYDAGSMGLLKNLDMRFWNLFGGVTLPSGSLCSAAGIAALVTHYGKNVCHDPEDIPNSRFIILWGKNPAVTSVHMLPLIREARDLGAKVVLIDPVRSESAALADQVVQPRPGSDGALALAMAAVIIEEDLVDRHFVQANVCGFDEFVAHADTMSPELASGICGVPASTIEELAREYAMTKPASIWIGFGLQRHAGGGGTVRAIDALSVITGNIGVQGGGTNYSHRNTKRMRLFDAREYARNTRFIPRASLGSSLAALDDPPIEAIVVARSNPLCQSPRTAMVKEAFSKAATVVVIDQFLTDTADVADVFLPCTTFLEEDDIYVSYWHNLIGYGPKMVGPPGEVRSDLDIWTALAGRLGLGRFFSRSAREWIEYSLKPLAPDGITLASLEANGPVRDPLAPVVPWSDGKFATGSGKLELYSSSARLRGEDPLPGYVSPHESSCSEFPFTLISSQPRWRIHSQFDQFNKYVEDAGRPWLRIHPSPAEARKICDGDMVRVMSRWGEALFSAKLDSRLRPDVIVAYNGRPIKRGGGVNFLTGEYVSDIGLQAAFYDCACEVEKA